MNIVNLIGKVTMLNPVELESLSNTNMFAISTTEKDNTINTHVLSARGKYKSIAQSLSLGQMVAVQGSLTNHKFREYDVTIISVNDLLIL
jgi:hypothetical protein